MKMVMNNTIHVLFCCHAVLRSKHKKIGASRSLIDSLKKVMSVTSRILHERITFSLKLAHKKNLTIYCEVFAENEGFEPPVLLQTTVFKTAAFDHSANSPSVSSGIP